MDLPSVRPSTPLPELPVSRRSDLATPCGGWGSTHNQSHRRAQPGAETRTLAGRGGNTAQGRAARLRTAHPEHPQRRQDSARARDGGLRRLLPPTEGWAFHITGSPRRRRSDLRGVPAGSGPISGRVSTRPPRGRALPARRRAGPCPRPAAPPGPPGPLGLARANDSWLFQSLPANLIKVAAPLNPDYYSYLYGRIKINFLSYNKNEKNESLGSK